MSYPPIEPMPPGSNSNDKVTFLDHLNNPMYKLHRYLVLIVLCFINIGKYANPLPTKSVDFVLMNCFLQATTTSMTTQALCNPKLQGTWE